MKILVKESTVVRPAVVRPQPTSLWLSNLDMMLPMNYHTLVAYFYRFNSAANFFDSTILKAALSCALVPFYPVAGRLRWNGKRIEINCNDEGVLFVDAESDGVMDELGDFSPRPDLRFVPVVDYSKGIEMYPLFLVQVTRFKCGGICLGIGSEHHLWDGASALHFTNTWSDIARGLDVTIPPFLDRTVLSARNPAQPHFPHIEYQPLPSLKTPQCDHSTVPRTLIFKKLRLTNDQVNALKAKCNENNGADTTYCSTYEVIAGHTWRCLTKARQLPEDQVTKMFIAVNGRSRLRPPLPQGFFGNALFTATPMATVDELLLKPLKLCVRKIHDAIARINHDYAISALDYLELQRDLISMARGPHTCKSPNVVMTSWAKLPIYDADFGWGRPVHVGPGAIHSEGKIYIMGSPVNDGSTSIAITLPEDQLKLFEQAFYEEDI